MPTRKPAKKVASKKSVSRPARSAAAPRRQVHPLHEHYFLDEQEAFFSKHKNAQMLLLVFILCVLAFFVMVYLRRDLYLPTMMSY